MRPLAPYKGCTDRTTGDRTTDCHATCEKYLAYKEAQITAARNRIAYYMVESAIRAGHERIRDVPYSAIHGKNVHNKR